MIYLISYILYLIPYTLYRIPYTLYLTWTFAGTNEPPTRPKTLIKRPRKYFFIPRSILMLPGLKIPIKNEKNTKKLILIQKIMK